jgi:hypothetical protein
LIQQKKRISIMAVYGQITYAPPTPAPTNPIPTMGETMLIAMVFSLAFIAFKMTKKGQGGSHLNSFVAVGLALFVGLAGVSVVSDVGANGVIAYLSQSGGGVTDIVYANNEVHIINNSGARQKIQAITPVSPYTVQSTAPLYQCQVNDELDVNEGCYVMFVLPPS